MIFFTCLVGFALWISYSSQMQLRNSARDLFAGESAKMAMAVSFFFSRRTSELETLATDDHVRLLAREVRESGISGGDIRADSLGEVCRSFSRAMSEKIVGSEQVFSRIGLLDDSGRLILDTDSECLLLRGYGGYEKLKTVDGPLFETGESAGVMSLVVSVPVRSGAESLGTVVGWVRIESLHQSLSSITVSPSVGSDFLRIGNTVVAVSDASAFQSGQLLLMDALKNWNGMTVLEAGESGRLENYLAISSPVQGTSLSIISLVKERRIFGSLSLQAHLILSVFIFAAVAIGCYLLVLTIFKRQIYETKVFESGLRESEISAQKEKLEKEIKNRRLADALRKRAEIRYRDIFDNAPVGIFQITLEGRYLTANAALADIFGYDSQDDLISSVNDVRSEIYANPSEWDAGIKLLKTTGLVTGYEVECQRKDGTTIWTSRDFRLVEGDPGFPAYLEGFVIDISARKKAETEIENNQKRLRSLFDNSPVALWELDLSRVKELFDSRGNGATARIRDELLQSKELVADCVGLIRVLDSNNLAAEFLKARTGDEGSGNIFSPYVTDQGWRFFKTVFLDFASGQFRHRSEIQLTRDDGKMQFLIINCSIVPGFEDSWTRVLATIEDISELKRIENELRISREQAEKANEAKGHFLANMSHEFRTPMNAIKGMVQLLQRSELTDEQQENLRLIKSSVDSLLVIVNDILDFSKLDSVHMELSEENLDLPSFLKDLRDVMDIGAMNKKLEVRLEAPGIPACVRADGLRLRQVLTNLLGNAVKFTDEGEVVLRCSVATQPASSEKATLFFEVSDTGIGLPEDKIDSLFKSFVQADPSITRKYGGTGLGLAICYRLVKLMGGELSARNNEDGGASFSFTLQLEKCSEMKKPLEDNRGEVSEAGPDLSRVKVLVAEDSRMNQILLRKVFQKNGINDYQIVENGKDCVDAFTKSDDYDIIFMDIQMPVMDGFEAARAIRRLHSPVRIVALSANAGEDFHKQCIDSGMNSRIVKPFNVEDLLAEIALVSGGQDEKG
ncbi:ATP-binding protein [Maridesulfovibrio sp. FT414]|uniref:ATP-binding protein n=1 Tax=Maridesulfovibrio sp. FT414 TaxID=2979469 RepID=UPI003D8059DB